MENLNKNSENNISSEKAEDLIRNYKYQEALDIFENILKKNLDSSEPNKINFAYDYRNISRVQFLIGKYLEAKENALKSLDIATKLLKEDDPYIIEENIRLSEIYAEYDCWDECEKCINFVKEKNKNTYGERDKFWIHIYELMGKYLNGQKKFYHSIKAIEKAESLVEEHFGHKSKEMANLYHLKSKPYFLRQEYEKSMDYLKEALKIREEIFGKKSLEVAECFASMFLNYLAIGDVDKGLETGKNAIDIRRNIFGGENHRLIGESYITIAPLYLGQDPKKSLEYAQKALSIFEKCVGSNSYDCASCYQLMAMFLCAVEPTSNKINEYFENSLKIRNLHFGETHLKICELYEDWGAIKLQTTGEGFEPLFEKSLKIKEEILRKNDPNLALAYFKVSETIPDKVEQSLNLIAKGIDVLIAAFENDIPTTLESEALTKLCTLNILYPQVNKIIKNKEQEFKKFTKDFKSYEEVLILVRGRIKLTLQMYLIENPQIDEIMALMGLV